MRSIQRLICAVACLLSLLDPGPARAASDGTGEALPITGTLTASKSKVAAGGKVRVDFQVSPLTDLKGLELAVRLPASVALIEGRTQGSFRDLRAGKAVGLSFVIQARTPDTYRLIGSATLEESQGLVLRQAFVLDLNKKAAPPKTSKPGQDARGRPLIMY